MKFIGNVQNHCGSHGTKSGFARSTPGASHLFTRFPGGFIILCDAGFLTSGIFQKLVPNSQNPKSRPSVRLDGCQRRGSTSSSFELGRNQDGATEFTEAHGNRSTAGFRTVHRLVIGAFRNSRVPCPSSTRAYSSGGFQFCTSAVLRCSESSSVD